MRPEELVRLKVFQIDIILCWIGYILKVMVLPTAICILIGIEHWLSKSIKEE